MLTTPEPLSADEKLEAARAAYDDRRATKEQLKAYVRGLLEEVRLKTARLTEMTDNRNAENAGRVRADEINRVLSRQMAEERAKYATAVVRLQKVIMTLSGQLADTSDVVVKINVQKQPEAGSDESRAIDAATRAMSENDRRQFRDHRVLPLDQFPWRSV